MYTLVNADFTAGFTVYNIKARIYNMYIYYILEYSPTCNAIIAAQVM